MGSVQVKSGESIPEVKPPGASSQARGVAARAVLLVLAMIVSGVTAVGCNLVSVLGHSLSSLGPSTITKSKERIFNVVKEMLEESMDK